MGHAAVLLETLLDLLLLVLLLLQFLDPGLLHVLHGLRVLVHRLNELAQVRDPELLQVNRTALRHLDEHFL